MAEQFMSQIRMDKDLKDKIQEIADLEHRSFNAQMVYFLEACVMKYKPRKTRIKTEIKKSD